MPSARRTQDQYITEDRIQGLLQALFQPCLGDLIRQLAPKPQEQAFATMQLGHPYDFRQGRRGNGQKRFGAPSVGQRGGQRLGQAGLGGE